MKCPHCQQEHTDNAKFCPVTGLEIRQEEVIKGKGEPESKICQNCGKPIFIDGKFCPTCGLLLSKSENEDKMKIGKLSPIAHNQPKEKRKQQFNSPIFIVLFVIALVASGFLIINNLLPQPIISFSKSPFYPQESENAIVMESNSDSEIPAKSITSSPHYTSQTNETPKPEQVPTREVLPLPTIDLNHEQEDQNESSIDSIVLSQMETIEKEVQELRGLLAATNLDRQTYTPDQLRQKVMDDFFVDYTEEDVRQDTIILNLFGLIERNFDLYDMFVELYSDQIAGFYDDETKEMVVLQGEEFAGPERMTYVHEYTHALQDAQYNLNDGLKLDNDTCDLDSEYCAAVTALVEGDASFVQTQWFLNYSSLKDKQEVMQYYQEYESTVFDNTPAFLQEDLIFPYVKGIDFVTQLYEGGGFAAVDQAYLNPPVSTEQIMHPERYPDDSPISIDLDDFSNLLGDGWEEIDRNTFGEWYTYLMFAKPLSEDWAIDDENATEAAEGWGGDEYLVYHNQDLDQEVLISLSQWDTQSDADEYWDSFTSYGTKRWGPTNQNNGDELAWKTGLQIIIVRRQANQVLWIMAPDQDLAQTVADQFPSFQ